MKRWQNVKVLVIVAVCYLVLELVFGITCPILFLTGISCAGCGGGFSAGKRSDRVADFGTSFRSLMV